MATTSKLPGPEPKLLCTSEAPVKSPVPKVPSCDQGRVDLSLSRVKTRSWPRKRGTTTSKLPFEPNWLWMKKPPVAVIESSFLPRNRRCVRAQCHPSQLTTVQLLLPNIGLSEQDCYLSPLS